MDGIAGFGNNGTSYIYRKNAQGDITHIYNPSGVVVAKYDYDAWGNHKVYERNANGLFVENTNAMFIGNINPFRYRGYYFDTDSKLFYLKSRYYDPEVGRFISSDSIEYLDPENIGGLNLYSYCGNDPVMFWDGGGNFAISIFLAFVIGGLITGAVIGGATGGIAAYNNGARGWELVGGIALGTLTGAALGAGIGALIGLTAPAISGFLSISFPLFTFTKAVGDVLVLSTVSVTGAQLAGATALIGGLVFFAKRTGKESSSDKPSWINGDMVDPSKSAQQNAIEMLNKKYGTGNWGTGAGSEYSKIVKWIIRKIFFKG